MVMIMVNVADAKARLSELLESVDRGEEVVICKHNRPVAELRAVPASQIGPRDLTPIFPGWTIDPGFFEPLPPDEIALWEGAALPGATRVAEDSPAYGLARKPRRKQR
jgi:prevent-host-death family protein